MTQLATVETLDALNKALWSFVIAQRWRVVWESEAGGSFVLASDSRRGTWKELARIDLLLSSEEKAEMWMRAFGLPEVLMLFEMWQRAPDFLMRQLQMVDVMINELGIGDGHCLSHGTTPAATTAAAAAAAGTAAAAVAKAATVLTLEQKERIARCLLPVYGCVYSIESDARIEAKDFHS